MSGKPIPETVRALADELMEASEYEDDVSVRCAYADAAGRVRTLAEALTAAQQQGQAVEGCPHCGGTGGHWEGCRAPVDIQHMQQQQGQAVAIEGTDAEVLREFIRICREHKPVGQWPGERVCAAIERSMANERPFRFIAEADMAPEREPSMKDADRALSGPRRNAAPPPSVPVGVPPEEREAFETWKKERAALATQHQEPKS